MPTTARKSLIIDAGEIRQIGTSDVLVDGNNNGYLLNGSGLGTLVASDGTTNATLGEIGEYNAATKASASALALTTNVALTILSLTLIQGDWELEGAVGYIPTATTNITNYAQGFSTVNNAFAALGTYTTLYVPAGVPGVTGPVLPIGRVRFLTTGPSTTIYLIARSGFTVSTNKAYGYMSARRMR